RGPWFWFLLSLAASLGANVATSGVLDLTDVPVALRVLVAGWPAVAFLGGALLLHSRKVGEGPVHEEPHAAGEEPPAELVEDGCDDSVTEPERPVLVSYAQAAEELGVAPETIRGAANGPKARLTKYSGLTPNTVRVDLNEVRRVIRRPAGV
ncbi:SpdA protein, partial [Streptomyces spectabilis]